MSQSTDPSFISIVHPPVQSEASGALMSLSSAIKSSVEVFSESFIGKELMTIERAVFDISIEKSEPNFVVFADEDSEDYPLDKSLKRFHYHFPTAKYLLVTTKSKSQIESEITTDAYSQIHYFVSPENAVILTDFLIGGKTNADFLYLNNSLLNKKNKVSEIEISFETKGETGGFTDYRLNTPVAPKSLGAGESIPEILARSRKIGKFLLVIPPQGTVYGVDMKPPYPALGVLYLASMLEKAGHACEIIDMDADDVTMAGLYEFVDQNEFDGIGFHSVTPTYALAVEASKEIRKRKPHIKQMIGGIHATVNPKPVTLENVFDYVVVGEAECTIVELADAILEGGDAFKTVKGIAYLEGGDVVSTGRRSLLPEMDDLPYPAYHLLRTPMVYQPPDATVLPVASIMVSRGCPGQCTYCQTKNIFGRRTRFRSAENVIGEVRHLVKTYGIREIHLTDDVVTANRKFVMKFCELLAKEPYKLHLAIPNGVRADMVNEEMLSALKKVGLTALGFGIETGSDRVAKIVKKGITKAQVRKAISLVKKVGLDSWGFFIIGLPGDNKESVMDTISFAIELNPKFAKFLILKPYPGSEVFMQLNEKGLVDHFDYSEYGAYHPPVHHLDDLSQADILRLQKLAWRKFYFRPSKILEHLMGIRSLGRLTTTFHSAYFVLTRVLHVFQVKGTKPTANLKA